MVAQDESALICDFAQTYHIYDYKALRPSQAAIYAAGLPDDSRIKMKLSGRKLGLDTMLLAAAVDRLSILIWAKTKDAERGQNKPKSILEALTAEDDDSVEFDTIEAYEAARARVIGG